MGPFAPARRGSAAVVAACPRARCDAHRKRRAQVVGEIERLFPQVEQIVAASDFGRDAIDKARAIVSKARSAIGKRDVGAVKAEIEGLSRTHRMFKGVVSKTH